MEIGSLTYEEFNACLSSLNDLYDERRCLLTLSHENNSRFISSIAHVSQIGLASAWTRMGK